MKLSIWSGFYYELSPEEAVLRFLENGIESTELSDEHAIALLNRSDNVVQTGTEFAAFLKSTILKFHRDTCGLRLKYVQMMPQ